MRLLNIVTWRQQRRAVFEATVLEVEIARVKLHRERPLIILVQGRLLLNVNALQDLQDIADDQNGYEFVVLVFLYQLGQEFYQRYIMSLRYQVQVVVDNNVLY